MGGFRVRIAMALAACAVAGGCVGYGFPGDGGYSTYPGGGSYPAYPGSGGRTMRCESHDRKRNRCAADTRRGVDIVRRFSDAPCVQGRSWGWDGYGVWVDDGCRAEFAIGGGYGGPAYPGGGYGQGRVVRCESHDKRYSRCNVPVHGGVQLQHKLSDAGCKQGSSWGWDRNGIWVDRGCRADFLVY